MCGTMSVVPCVSCCSRHGTVIFYVVKCIHYVVKLVVPLSFYVVPLFFYVVPCLILYVWYHVCGTMCFMLFQTWYRDILCCKMHPLCCKISGTTFFLCGTTFFLCGTMSDIICVVPCLWYHVFHVVPDMVP